jgi:hypothetical protein
MRTPTMDLILNGRTMSNIKDVFGPIQGFLIAIVKLNIVNEKQFELATDELMRRMDSNWDREWIWLQ